jgi:hypothetical protein
MEEVKDCLVYRGDFVAEEDGRIFLFANDVIAFWDRDFFYRHRSVGNVGVARVYFHDLSGIRPVAGIESKEDSSKYSQCSGIRPMQLDNEGIPAWVGTLNRITVAVRYFPRYL